MISASPINGEMRRLIKAKTGSAKRPAGKNSKNRTGTGTISRRWKAFEPQPLPNGMDALLPEGHVRTAASSSSVKFYDFLRPSIWLRDINDSLYTFLLLGLKGNWRLNGGRVSPA